MTTTLIVLAHPERRSFNGAWSDATEQAARSLGDETLRIDLCGQAFNGVESAGHYKDHPEGALFDPLKTQEAATGDLPPEVADGVDKLRACDRVVFHFPLWWFAPPAVLKGWFDRVLAHGTLHSIDQRFDTGLMRGKTALFCVTAGASAAETGPDGKEGDARLLLWPAAYTLRYVGFDVLEPVIVPGVHGYHEGAERQRLEARLADVLADQLALMRDLGGRAKLRFNPDSDFDETGRLRPDRPSHSPFIQRAAHG